MEKKNLKLAITLIIAVVIIGAFVVVRQMQVAKEPGELQVYSGAAVKGQLNSILASQCLASAHNEYENLWNQECKERNLEDKCGLPRELASELREKYRKFQEECSNKYPTN